MTKVGDYCRSHKDLGRAGDLIGCSGEGRPSCRATECLYGAEPCPAGNHWKPEGNKCNFCPAVTGTIQLEVSHDNHNHVSAGAGTKPFGRRNISSQLKFMVARFPFV